MTSNGILRCLLYIGALTALAKPLGEYMARVYEGHAPGLERLIGPLERVVYRLCGVKAGEEMTWQRYSYAMLAFNGVGLLVVYLLQRLQLHLPLNPMRLGAVSPDSAFNTAVSFASNTNWQGYGGETTMSYLTQMLGLTVQNFVSAATGMAILVALIRGFARKQAETIGNFWVDLTRTTLYILLPLSAVLALFLVSQGVVQTFRPSAQATLLQPAKDSKGGIVNEQTIALGPAASQVAIKQLGTNGGGFFNVNSSHPFENPTPLSNFLEMLAINLIGAALCCTFGRMTGDARQGWALFGAMTIIFASLLALCVVMEQKGNPALAKLGVNQAATELQPGGNMEGKEARFGVVDSAIWATATTAASNGSVNSMHDSFTPLGGFVPLVMILLGEIVYGGVGSGLYGMILFVVVAVFLAGLMVGRTPEYLGKKVEAYEMKMASIGILVPAALVLLGTALAVVTAAGRTGPANPGPHGFSEILYAFASAGNNNGSAFAGLSANTFFYNTSLGVTMFFARYWIAIPVLAMAGSLARKKLVPASGGTLPTHTPLFVFFLIAVILLVGALTFFPALALGPVVEHLMLAAR
ncbi:MAG: potassium-transporting ATPase subunit KdpA [Elusimicrobia bacterium]|nr:potassium-transporting ATPase subunit KdpA [Elusimicrobiota bacterium]MDE2425528.1 potassium-transporting ATPase subunit KdpA [Elusimicrobiota bacterium]